VTFFVAMPGLKTHGAQFAGKALENGAVAIVTDGGGSRFCQASPRAIQVCGLFLRLFPFDLLRRRAANSATWPPLFIKTWVRVCPKFFGTTGTNGKTSTTYLLEAILRQLGETIGLTSTAERHIAGEVIVSRLTTPESTEMQALIARMRERSVSAIAIESFGSSTKPVAS
jgi:UDP-N-acetylmuramoyl-L-alanyl-D-glutamate--2,6-diaminopimelate ligase